MWKCPACNASLIDTQNGWRCDNNHSYDRAKEGYVNLLLAQHKRSKDPGDNKDMINARRAFLDEGHYHPLASHIAQVITNNCKNKTLHIFDAGCGEGYYLSKIVDAVGQNAQVEGAGIDISKVAIQKAAKRYKKQKFAVASCFQIPIDDEWSNAVIQVFAPSLDEEIHRILQPGGLWLQVNPGAEHLKQIKEMVYDKPQAYQQRSDVPEGFGVHSQQQVTFDFSLSTAQSRLNLLKMTPFYWSTPEDKCQRILTDLVDVRADFDVRVLQKEVR